MRVCAITNVYNEAFNLPIWLRYYGAQVGIAHCVVIDHGSDDGSTDDLRGAARIDQRRSPLDDEARAVMIADLVAEKLRDYDAVLYTDCDEFLVVDPDRHANLVDFAKTIDGPAATAIGLNIVQRESEEAPLDPTRPILAQRAHALFAPAMCKTLLVRAPVRWSAGFHDVTAAPAFGGLYLVHLRWVDRAAMKRRMTITRSLARVHDDHGLHQRMDEQQVDARFAGFARRPVDHTFDLAAPLRDMTHGVTQDGNGLYVMPRTVAPTRLMRLPARFARSGL